MSSVKIIKSAVFLKPRVCLACNVPSTSYSLPLFEAVEFGGVLRMLPCRMQESMELDKLSSYSASAGCRLPVEVMSLILALLFRKTMGWKLV